MDRLATTLDEVGSRRGPSGFCNEHEMRLGQALAYLAASAVSLTAAQETELEECVIKSRIGTFDLRPLRRKGACSVSGRPRPPQR